MLSLATAAPIRHHAPMVASDNIKEARALGEALARLRSRAKLSQADAGGKVGMSGEGWRKYESGAPGIFKPATQHRLTAALGFTVQDLLAERDSGDRVPSANIVRLNPMQQLAPSTTGLPIRGPVVAGAWLATDAFLDQSQPRRFPASPDPRFPTDAQWLSPVVGDSVDQLGIFDGDFVHLVDIASIGYHPMTDDIVLVERTRFQGREVEVSLKQAEITPTGPIFWPRSNNPRWREPLDLRDGARHDEDIDVRVRAIVLNSIRRLWNPSRRF